LIDDAIDIAAASCRLLPQYDISPLGAMLFFIASACHCLLPLRLLIITRLFRRASYATIDAIIILQRALTLLC